MPDIVKVRCRLCDKRYDQERNGHFAPWVHYAELSFCSECCNSLDVPIQFWYDKEPEKQPHCGGK
jgi:hypothetical protein